MSNTIFFINIFRTKPCTLYKSIQYAFLYCFSLIKLRNKTVLKKHFRSKTVKTLFALNCRFWTYVKENRKQILKIHVLWFKSEWRIKLNIEYIHVRIDGLGLEAWGVELNVEEILIQAVLTMASNNCRIKASFVSAVAPDNHPLILTKYSFHTRSNVNLFVIFVV